MRVLVAGGGVAALETVLALRTTGGPRLSIELLAPDQGFLDRPSSVATAFGFGAAEPLALDRIARQKRIEIRRGALAAVEPDRARVITDDGRRLPYDALVVATGACAHPVVPGATTFTGPADAAAVEALIARAAAGEVRRLVFALPHGVTWSLPLYELAIMAAVELRQRAAPPTRITVLTPERRPLWLFGAEAADALERLLAERDVELCTDARAVSVTAHGVLLAGGELVPADAVVALPALAGPHIRGLPADANGFIPVDAHGRVSEVSDVYAAGDATAFPIKQGGLATQQADAVAETIAATAGPAPEPRPFRPVLRGVLLTGGAPLYLRAELSTTGDVVRTRGTTVTAPRGVTSTRALWWPPAKVAGRYLAPFLASARPRDLGGEPLRDRTARGPGTGPADADAAFAMAVLVAEEDARLGDFTQAVHALDAAAALRGGVLPGELRVTRADWAHRAAARRPGDAPWRSGAAAYDGSAPAADAVAPAHRVSPAAVHREGGTMYSTIVVGVDGSEHGLAATRFAAALARRFTSRLIVAGVFQRGPHVRTDGGAAERLARSEAEEAVERGLAAAADVPHVGRLVAAAATPAAGLHEIARAERADLLVVGTSERRRIAGTQPGSVTEHVLHHSPCPVAVVPPSDRDPTLRRIGVAMDEREPARAALSEALALAGRVPDEVEEIVVLHAQPPEPMFVRPGMELPSTAAVQTPDWLLSLVEALEAPVPVRIQTEPGGASGMVASRAADLDLLLMGSRDRGAVRRLVMGSVSTSVVRQAACPVIVVFGRTATGREADAQTQTAS
jgi:sulfide:quinone oxidoreductase